MQTAYPLPQAPGRTGAGKPRRRWQRAVIVPALLLALGGGGAVWWRSTQATAAVTTSTAAVSQGELALLVSGSGSAAAARTADLSFEQAGSVTAVNVQVGDSVTAGQALATIDATDLQLALDLAKANLAAAEASLSAAQGGSATAQDLATAQAQLTSAQAQLSETETGSATASDIASAKAQLASAKAQLSALTSPSDADLRAAESKVAQAQLALQSTRDSASQQKTNAEIALKNAVNSLTQSQVAYATAKGHWDFVQETGQDPTNPDTTDSAGNEVPNKLSDTQRQQYYDAFAKAQAALSSAENAVTQAQVAADAARQSEVTLIAQAEASVADAQADLDALTSPTATDLAQARASVTQAQANLASLTAGASDAERAQAEAIVTQAQASLDSLTAPASDAELAQAQVSLLQAQVSLDTAQANLDAATLSAPFDGVVAAVNVSEGGSASAGTAAVTVVDQSPMSVSLSLSESDIADVAVGQPVTLTFDALPDVSLEGTVETIAPVASSDQNVVTYAVAVSFDPADSGVKVGMSAAAEIATAQVSDALLVPTRALTTEGDISFVTVRTPAGDTRVAVETGLSSDGRTQIVSSGGNGAAALTAGDQLVIAGSGSTSTSSSSSTQSAPSGLSGLTGAGGPPPGP